MPKYWEMAGPLTVFLTPSGLQSPRLEFIIGRYGDQVTLSGSRLGISKGGGCQQSTNDILLSFSAKPTDCAALHYDDIDHIEDAEGRTFNLPTDEMATT